MLALSPARRDESRNGERGEGYNDDFFTTNSSDEFDLLDSIDFDDLFNGTGDLLPDLEIDPQILSSLDYFSDHLNPSSTVTSEKTVDFNQDEINKSLSDSVNKSEEVVSKRDDDYETVTCNGNGNGDRKRKFPSSKNNRSSNEGKRKVKVDWTAELHRRFVEAVEQLGVEKAVPSRILDLMGIHSLTRHNVASHLQKYRSHRKHLLAREAEAANWTRKRHIYTGAAGDTCRKNSWLAPTIGFPPPPPPPPLPRVIHHPHFRPLHVWGHPTVDQSLMPHLWPKHLPPPSNAVATPPFWISDPPCWHQVHTGTTPYLPTVATRFRTPPVAGIPHHAMYKAPNGVCAAVAGQAAPRPPPPVDLHPSKESVDAAIGEVLTRPWLPLPLGLKPPAVDGVMAELHRHGVSEVPPTTAEVI